MDRYKAAARSPRGYRSNGRTTAVIVRQRFRSLQAAPGYGCSTSVSGVDLLVVAVEVGAWGQTLGVDVGAASSMGRRFWVGCALVVESW